MGDRDRQTIKLANDLTAGDTSEIMAVSEFDDLDESIPRDLSATTAIELRIEQPDGTIATVVHTAINLLLGQYKFEAGVGDLVEGNDQCAQIHKVGVTTPGKVETSDNILIDVKRKL